MLRRLLPLLLLLAVLLPAAPAQAATPYRWTAKPIDAATAKRMHTSYRAGCPVPLRDLRYLTMTYVDFAGKPQTGEMVVHADVARNVARAFGKLYAQHFPLRRMRLVDDFGGSDDRSMAADNTSAFNCRKVSGTSSWSMHAYGRAVDISPVENPYVFPSGKVEPPAGKPYAKRSPARKGMVTRGVVEAFKAEGWGWGGYFKNAKDWQHFSRNGK
ncbi:MAG: hypothetical protein JWN87_1243 [Frankiales bacterium]|jgi:hypothetical protein|nr:hypothetical protein [Frankiales bacterium]MCW2586630.1 hypothetical protein [Frankiales bacterium]